jgi:hypothetical protein
MSEEGKRGILRIEPAETKDWQDIDEGPFQERLTYQWERLVCRDEHT